MANASTTGFGLRSSYSWKYSSYFGQAEYKIKSGLGVGIFKNNPVSLQDAGGDQGYLQDASFATTDDGGAGGAALVILDTHPLIGVFNGAFYIDTLQANLLSLTQLQQALHLELTIIR